MPSPNSIADRGAFSDAVANAIQYQLSANTAVVSLTNPTSATDLMTYTFPSGMLNGAGRGFELLAVGTYNLAATSTLVFTVKLGGVTLGTITTASQTNTSVTLKWSISAVGLTVTPGIAGTMEFFGNLTFDSGATLAAASSSFLDSNTAVLTAINYSQPLLLECMANLGSGNASSVIAQRIMQVQLYQ